MGFENALWCGTQPLPPAYPATRNDYGRWYWNELEPVEGQYAFAIIDRALANAKARNAMFSFRIMPSPAPAWLKARGVRVMGTGSEELVDHNHPEFLRCMERIVRAFAARYDGHPHLHHVDIGSVGNWGEWNCAGVGSGGEALMPTADNARRIVDWYDTSFRATPLVALDAGAGYANTVGAGYRADCFGDYGIFGTTWNHMVWQYPRTLAMPEVADSWRSAPTCFEICGVMDQWVAKGFDIDLILAKGLEWRTSLLNGKNSPVPLQYRAKVDEWLKRIGYRFVLSRLEHASTVAAGATVTLSSSWINRGVAPTYHAWPLAYRLRSGEQVVAQWRSSADVRTWLPGAHSRQDAFAVPATLGAGTYAVDIALLAKDGTRAFVDLAIAGRRADGWYALSSLQVGGDVAQPNQAPIARIAASATSGVAPLAVTFSGAGSSDADGIIAAHAWAFADGGVATGASSSRTFAAGNHVVRLTVTDDRGATGQTSVTIAVAAAPQPPAPTQGPYGGVARPIPGTIQAEDFDQGGEGVAYHDLDATNNGGGYRATAVDVRGCVDAGAGWQVGWMGPGEWLEYTVSIAAAGTYELGLRVSSGTAAGAAVNVQFDGGFLTGDIAFAATGGWDTFATVRKAVTLPSGTHVLRLSVVSGALDLNHLSFTAPTQTPYGGVARAVPGTIQAEDFDQGGEGVAYHDLDTTNNGGGYRATAVDIRGCVDAGAGWQVGWMGPGEWLEYTVSIASAGSYDLGLRVASGNTAGATVRVLLDGGVLTGDMAFAATGGWDSWTTVRKAVTLPAGTHVLRLSVVAGALDLNHLSIAAAAAAPSGIVSGAVYKLVAKHSGKCLEVAGGSIADGADVRQWSDTGTMAQQWTTVANGDGTWTLTARCSGKALHVAAASTADGADIVQSTATGGAHQRWRLEAVGGGWYRVVCAQSGKVMDVAASSTADGANVLQWTSHGGDNQRWELVPVLPGGAG
ncbi:MAG TPA: carbohydrate-binding protein [Planctomycetota bacterium]|nr:carbohydrate-binding protein [Planctomycetota bacterium]